MDGLLARSENGRTPSVAIVGAGMSGLCMGIKLKQAGIDSFEIYEKAEAVGGTWRDNTYPGLSCDVPSRFYQYSFELNPDWSHAFSPGPEIWRYFERVADKYGLRSHIRFGKEVVSGHFEDGRCRIRTSDGEKAMADFLVSACGVLHHPRVPAIPGLERFSGAAFHSARWDHDVELRGRRIAVVGTGSTGVQIVTDLSEVAGRLLHFQRTPQWILPAPNRRYTRLERALHRRLTPDYRPMCKRLVVSSGFYRAMQRPTVELVREGIDRIEPGGIVTADGRLHEVDVIVFATGFDTHAYVRPMELLGQGGITLDEAWRDGPRAHRTVAIAGFPN